MICSHSITISDYQIMATPQKSFCAEKKLHRRCMKDPSSTNCLTKQNQEQEVRSSCTESDQDEHATGQHPRAHSSLIRIQSWDKVAQFDQTVEEKSSPLDEARVEEILGNENSCFGIESADHAVLFQTVSPGIILPAPERLCTRASRSRDSFTLLPVDASQNVSFEYKGICANPPEITKRGMTRGNTSQMHRKAWLEVSDPKHRYGKNLRLYYRHWQALGFPTNSFFDWLDSKGTSAGNPLPSLEDCPRSVLDNDTVRYIADPNETSRYAVDFTCEVDGRCRVVSREGAPIDTGTDGQIFVLRDGIFYAASKECGSFDGTTQRFHHSSFFAGKAVTAAGIFITDRQGYLQKLYPHSGHYRPGEAILQRVLFILYELGIDLKSFQVDIQQLVHVNRHEMESGNCAKEKDEKKKKVDSLYLKPAQEVADYLSHKAQFIGRGIFADLVSLVKSQSILAF